MIYDIRMFLVNCEEKLTINQTYIRFHNIFCRFIVRAWNSTNFGIDKYAEYNKVLVKLYTDYYMKYQRSRYEDFHNKEFQQKCFEHQYSEEKKEAEESSYPQVKACAWLRDMNIVNKSMETIKNQIYRLKRIKAKSEKFSSNNIRVYFQKIKNRNRK